MVSSKYVNCDICEKVVKDTSLRKHIKAIHEKAREHICPHCNKAFSQRFTLKEHISAKHTKGYEHKCALCHRQFAHKTNFTRHMRTVHAGPIEPLTSWTWSSRNHLLVFEVIPTCCQIVVCALSVRWRRTWEAEEKKKFQNKRVKGQLVITTILWKSVKRKMCWIVAWITTPKKCLSKRV